MPQGGRAPEVRGGSGGLCPLYTQTYDRRSRSKCRPFDSVDFRRDIPSKLQGLPVRVIAEAMGASISHGSKVRAGHLIPHRRHWKKLADIS